jgi:four helix bundle protein
LTGEKVQSKKFKVQRGLPGLELQEGRVARLQAEFVARLDAFSDRVLDVAKATRRGECPAFVRDQMSRAGTSVGSNACEADEALTVPEFVHRLGGALKELSETKYWLRMVARRRWVKPERLSGLIDEGDQLTRIIATIIMRTNANNAARRKKPEPSEFEL